MHNFYTVMNEPVLESFVRYLKILLSLLMESGWPLNSQKTSRQRWVTHLRFIKPSSPQCTEGKHTH